jgi:thiamine-phosphate diphosphorylase
MRPVLCLITPPAVDHGSDAALVSRIGEAARAGVHLIHIRQPEREARALIALTVGAIEAVRGTRARVLVNDRVDVALAARAHGVHLRGDSIPAGRARRLVPRGFVLGRSVHSVEEATQLDGEGAVDYLIFGTVFPTSSKPGARVAGVGALGAVCEATRLPVLAVGGMTADRAGAVAAAGAAGIAAIGLFGGAEAGGLQVVVQTVISAFDTPRTVP